MADISVRRPFTLTNQNDIAILGRPPGFRRRDIGRISLTAPAMTEDRRMAEEDAINDEYHACGCPESAVGLLLGVGAYLLGFSALGGFDWHGIVGTVILGTGHK